MTNRRLPLPVLAALLACSALLVSSHRPSRPWSVLKGAPLDWFDEMEAFYAANPELKDTPGSGWKPYNRIKWFQSNRMFNGELPAIDARWNAAQIRQQRQSQVAARRTGSR
jgi:hypothetical protein